MDFALPTHNHHLKTVRGTSLVVQGLRLHTPNAGGLGLIPRQGTRFRMLQLRACMLQLNDSCMMQLKILHATTKDPTRCN